MKDIRIFVASSKELERERNELAFLVLEQEEEFTARGLRVRLAKWEYVDPKMTEGRTEDRYLDEMYNSDAALILFRDIAGKYTKLELAQALAKEKDSCSRLKTHQILFAADGAPDSDTARLRASLPEGSYGVWTGPEGLREQFLALVDRVAQCGGLVDAPSDNYVRKITAFLAADEELEDERNAFADTVLNVNDLLEEGHRNMRIVLRFYDPAHAKGIIESSEMGLVLYGMTYRFFGKEEIERTYERLKDGNQNPKRFYVFFHDLDAEREKALDEAFRTFREEFISKLGHFVCQFGDANALRLSFLLSLVRYTGEGIADAEIYSTMDVPEPGRPFVGREKELRRLCGLLEPVPGKFPAGRLPVITGAGGTGKSELVRQYASQCRVQYPGGVFLVDMEHARTWDEAFLGILKRIPRNNGLKVEEYLGLKDGEGGGERPKGPLTGADVRDALLRKAGESGAILLVLDNVEGCEGLLGGDGAFRQAFPAGFSERVRVNVVATARTCDIPLGETDWAQVFPLGDLSPEAAFELLDAEKKAVGDEEKKAAKRVAELLGYRALFVRRVPAILKGMNRKARVVCRSYMKLAEALEKDALGTISKTGTVDPSYWPARLWELVQGNLAEWGLGEACVKLVKIASFFSPDGFPRHVLRHLWNDLVFPGLEDWGSQSEVFDQVFDLARQYNIFQSDDPVRIHRLDRAAILQTAKAEPGLEDAIGAALASGRFLREEDWAFLYGHEKIRAHLPPAFAEDGHFWLDVLCEHPDFAEDCPWEKLDGETWHDLLLFHPQFADHCAWEKLSIANWYGLLEAQPQFADRCPAEYQTGHYWSWLLRRQPQFADRCPWEKLDGWNWGNLLRVHPQFAARCPWGTLNGRAWSHLLGSQPHFADRCGWEKLDGENWQYLLCEQPQLAVHCPWEKLDGKNWSELLCKQPQFADHCPWEKLTGGDWGRLLRKQPQFADRCPWEKLDGEDWGWLLCKQPQFADRCPWEKLTGNGWRRLLRQQPQFAERCQWKKLDGRNLNRLLSIQPQFAKLVPWENLRGVDWGRLLCKQPQFAERCDWEKLDGRAWQHLLCGQPQFADRCEWEKLTGEDWGWLLSKQPQFAERCPWEKLDSENWVNLLGENPQFMDCCPWEKLDSHALSRLLFRQPQFARLFPWENLTGKDWSCLLREQPRFADRCPWEKLDGEDWCFLLIEQPQFADRCPWEELNGLAWSLLLAEQPQFATHCSWKKLSGEDWSCLLCSQPQFADICPWEKLGVYAWREVLCSQPQFAERCPWEELNGEDWVEVLRWQPKFAEHCAWEKLSGGDWSYLLGTQPQFANRCPWKKLDGEDWRELLREQPQFADRCPVDKRPSGQE